MQVQINRVTLGPFADYVVSYNGHVVGAIDPTETENAYYAAVELGKQFSIDLKAGNVPAHYLR